MAKEDFCFTYYDGDAARDMAHMNRLERGAYSDIIVSQRKFGHLSISLIKKTLGNDFDSVWEALEIILKVDGEGKFFIEWLDTSIEKMRKQTIHQSGNGKKGGRPKANENPNPNPIETQTPLEKKPLEDGDGNEDGNEFKSEAFGKSENLFSDSSLLGTMLTVWKEKNSNYPADSEDLPAVRKFSEYICEKEGISYQPREPDVVDLVLTNWRVISEYASEHKLYSGFNLWQIYNYRKNIVTDIKNGKSTSKNGQPGGKGTRASVKQVFDQKYSD